MVRGVTAAAIVERAALCLNQLFGPNINEYAQPAHFKDDTLTVTCVSPLIAQEIKLREADFLACLNGQNSLGQVKKIKYIQMN